MAYTEQAITLLTVSAQALTQSVNNPPKKRMKHALAIFSLMFSDGKLVPSTVSKLVSY
jgi:hypothetical protein